MYAIRLYNWEGIHHNNYRLELHKYRCGTIDAAAGVVDGASLSFPKHPDPTFHRDLTTLMMRHEFHLHCNTTKSYCISLAGLSVSVRLQEANQLHVLALE